MSGDRDVQAPPAGSQRSQAPLTGHERTYKHALPVAALRGMRPRQWLKNGLVVAAPLAAGQLDHLRVVVLTGVAFLVFCAVASAVYLVNDVRDVEEDRRHPTKRFRPIADGSLPVPVALALAAALLVVGLVAAYVVNVSLGATMTAYVLIQAGYSLGLKHQPVLDLAVVASGFILRAIAGGVASDLALSQWFLLVAAFGSLFMVAGKRFSELHSLGAGAATRKSLENYSESYLRFVWGAAAATTVTFYALWAVGVDNHSAAPHWASMSIAPFTIGLLRYAVDIDRGLAGTPEDILLRDKVLQVLGAIWLVLLGLSAFGVGR